MQVLFTKVKNSIFYWQRAENLAELLQGLKSFSDTEYIALFSLYLSTAYIGVVFFFFIQIQCGGDFNTNVSYTASPPN